MLRAWRSGWARVTHAPAIAVGAFVVTVLLALPLALTLRQAIDAHLGASLMADRAADGVNWDWWQEFTAQATGLGTTFTPSVIGFASTLDSVSRVLDRDAPITPIASAIALYVVGWVFVSGGIIDRYARQRPTRTYGFFAASGVYFFRFLRLAIVAGIFYGWLFAYVHPWFFNRLYVDLTRNVSAERVVFVWRLVFYVIFGVLLIAVNLLIDYTKVRIVVEDRRSVLGALAAGARFIRSHPRDVLGLYALNSALFLAVVAVWALASPGAGGGLVAAIAAFVWTQVYVVARLLMKLQFVASQTALFQARLAHARYTAAPQPNWPDSAAAEAIVRSIRL
jgi:hypothetical protein